MRVAFHVIVPCMCHTGRAIIEKKRSLTLLLSKSSFKSKDPVILSAIELWPFSAIVFFLSQSACEDGPKFDRPSRCVLHYYYCRITPLFCKRGGGLTILPFFSFTTMPRLRVILLYAPPPPPTSTTARI